MGAFAAVLPFDARPADPRDAGRLLAAGPQPPAADLETSAGPTFAMARLRFPTHAHDAAGQPALRGSLAVLFDGRLDNRSELLDRLDLAGSLSDADLTAAAIERWGSEAPKALLGDFAFVAWDHAARRALLARDPLGIRTLYFHFAAGQLVCASEVAQVLAHPLVPARLDETGVAQFLAGEPENHTRTVYRDVHRVPPGHAVTITAAGVHTAAYWTGIPRHTIRYGNDEEYAAHCRDLLVSSVRCRLDPAMPAALALSGGLDSSAIAVVSSLLVDDRPAPQPFSLVYPAAAAADERPYLDAVAQRTGRLSETVLPAPVRLATLERWARRWRDLPATLADAMAVPLWEAMARRGHRVALTGAGGDFLFGGSHFHYADLIRRRALRMLVREWRANRRVSEAHGLRHLLVNGVWPALPSSVKQVARPLVRPWWRRRRREWLRVAVPPSVYPEAPRGGSFAVEDTLRGLTGGLHSYVLESVGRVALEAGVEVRHPLLDVRLVEFVLAIPEAQRRRGGIGKYVLRQALRRELPQMVVDRLGKADFSHAAVEAFQSAGDGFFEALEIARRGWVDDRRLAATFRRMQALHRRQSPAFGDDVPQLTAAAVVELWLRGAGHRTV